MIVYFQLLDVATEILDVINRFTYQVEDTELQQAAQVLNQQVQALTVLGQRQQALQQAFDKTAANEIDKRTRISGLIQKNKQAIDDTTQSIGKQVRENEKLQTAIVKEVGLINTLALRIKALTEERAKAFDTKQIQQFNREIEATQLRISQLTTSRKGGFSGGGIISAITQGVGIGTGIGLVTQGVGIVKDFITESSKLAAETEGVQRAFERLNEPDLLDNLQTATKGTVSDLELMKQAIQFNNFGLPLDKLATALEFARIRARDTGQSVDYLVQSIVTGIGRQSPLILDNLGINAKRVSDEFQKTGNFAEAAFKIIQEESKKAGEDIDTFAEKQARMSASIDNLKTRFGSLYNSILGEGALALERGFAIFEALNHRFVGTQDDTQKESIRSLDDYLKEYQNSDEIGRRIIENEVRASYERILAEQSRFEALGLQSTATMLNGQADLYRKFFKRLSNKELTFDNFNKSDLLGLTREELTALKEKGQQELNPLTAGDTAGIAKVNDRIKQIDEALARYSISVKKHTASAKKDVKENAIKPKDILELSPEAQQRELEELDRFITKIQKELDDRKGFKLSIGDTGVTGEPSGNSVNVNQTSDDILGQVNQIKLTEELQRKADADAKTARDKRTSEQVDAYNTITHAAIDSYQIILQSQIASADAEIAIRQSRVNSAVELAKNGNTQILEIEQKRLEESIKEREKYAQEQAALNAALTVSQSILAVATAAGESGAGAIVIVPAVIAAIAAGFAAVTALSKESQGFKDGVIDLQGEGDGKSDSIPAKLSKGESVITAEATAKNKEVLQAINAGAVFSKPHIQQVNTTSYANNMDMAGVIRELRSVKQAVSDNKFKQDIFFNEQGVGTVTERAMRNNKKRWS